MSNLFRHTLILYFRNYLHEFRNSLFVRIVAKLSPSWTNIAESTATCSGLKLSAIIHESEETRLTNSQEFILYNIKIL